MNKREQTQYLDRQKQRVRYMDEISSVRDQQPLFQKIRGDKRLELWEDEADIGFYQKEINKAKLNKKLVRLLLKLGDLNLKS